MTDEKSKIISSQKKWSTNSVIVICVSFFFLGFASGVILFGYSKFSKGVDTIVSVKEDIDKVKKEYGEDVKEIADEVKEKGSASIKAVSAEEIGEKGTRAVEDIIEDATKTFRDVTSGLRKKVKNKNIEKE